MIEQNKSALQERTARLSWSAAGLFRAPKILCVDDDAGFLSAFSALLELAGFSVAAVSDPARGLELVRRSWFDLAVLDYHMPGLNGAQLARQIRQTRPQIPVILLSASDSVPSADLQVFNRRLAKGEGFREILLAVRSSLGDAETAMRDDFAA